MELRHHGIRGMKWGQRRFQNADGSLKPAGEKRYGGDVKGGVKAKPNLKTNEMAAKGGIKPTPNLKANGMTPKKDGNGSPKMTLKERREKRKADKIALKESKKEYDAETKAELSKQKSIPDKVMYKVKRGLNRPAESIYSDKQTTAGKAAVEIIGTRIGMDLVSKYRDAQFNKFVNEANAESEANKAEFERFMKS